MVYGDPYALMCRIPVLLQCTLKHVEAVGMPQSINCIWWEVIEESCQSQQDEIPSVLTCGVKEETNIFYTKDKDDKRILLRRLHRGRSFIPPKVNKDTTLYCTVSGYQFLCFGMKLLLGRVQPAPENTWVDERLQRFLRETHRSSFIVRVASFNVLAPEYARTTQATMLYFPYCSAKVLQPSYRLPRIFLELLRVDCDILALQECSASMFQHLLFYFSDRYSLRFTLKDSRVPEGLCLIFDSKLFEQLDFQELLFKNALKEEYASLLTAIVALWPNFETNVLPGLTTVFQFLVLRIKGNIDQKRTRVLVVANTHLFFHPRASHIRILQCYILIHRLGDLRATYVNMGYDVSVILLGDFNSLLKSGAYEFLSTQRLSSNHSDWLLFNSFSFHANQKQKYQQLSSENIFQSLTPITPSELNLTWHPRLPVLEDSYAREENRTTTLVQSFEGTLDYIFFSPDTLQLVRVLPLPCRSSLAEQIGLPSPLYPSDHLCIAAELMFKELC